MSTNENQVKEKKFQKSYEFEKACEFLNLKDLLKWYAGSL